MTPFISILGKFHSGGYNWGHERESCYTCDPVDYRIGLLRGGCLDWHTFGSSNRIPFYFSAAQLFYRNDFCHFPISFRPVWFFLGRLVGI
jgi:hypothetical protein